MKAQRFRRAKFPVIHAAALEACDAADGVKDGIIEDPTRCKFDPKVLECKDGDGPTLPDVAQVETARKIYSDVINPRTKQELFPGHEPGSELGWGTMAGPQAMGAGAGTVQVHRLQEPGLGLPDLQLRQRCGADGAGRWRRDERARSEPQSFPGDAAAS